MQYLIAMLCCMVAASPLQAAHKVTIVVEFTEHNAHRFDLQMKDWQILLGFAGTELQVNYEHASLPRALELLQRPGYCGLNKRKTPERLKKYLFTKRPLTIDPPPRLIVLAPQALPKSVVLADWLTHQSQVKIGIMKGRSYGTQIDALIQQRPEHFYLLASEDSPLVLWQLLQKGRIDALIDYGPRLIALQELQPKALAVQTAGIEGEPLFITGYIACNKTPHGQQLIQWFDTLLASPSTEQRLLASYQKNFTQAQWQALQAQLQEVLQGNNAGH